MLQGSRIRIHVRTTVVAFLFTWVSVMLPVEAARAESDEQVLAVGAAESDVLSKLSANRTRTDAMDTVEAARQSAMGRGTTAQERHDEHVEALREHVRGAHHIAMDLGELEPHPDHRILLKAAKKEGVPVVLDNVDHDKMLALMDVGVEDTKTVVVEHDKLSSITHHHFLGGEGPELTDLFDLDELENDEQILEAEGQTMLEWIGDDPGVRPDPDAPIYEAPDPTIQTAEPSNVLIDTHQEVEKILLDRPFSSGASSQYQYTGSNICNGAPSCTEQCLHWGTKNWTPPNHGRANMGIYYCYAVVNAHNYDWLVVRTRGSVGAWMGANSSSDRGYYIEDLITSLSVALPSSSWHLDQTAPDNVNGSGSYSTTTGFTLEGTGGYDTAQVSGGYSQSNSQKANVQDFRIENKHTYNPNTRWDYELSSTEGNRYNSWKNLIKWNAGGRSLFHLPSWAQNGFSLGSEAVWKGPAHQSGTFHFRPYERLRIRRVWKSSGTWQWARFRSQSQSARWTKPITSIHIP